jgi:AraC-like DNA-binding protein
MPYVRVVCGANVTNEFARHVHHEFCIGSIAKGARVVLQAGISVVIPQHAMFAINAGMAHACRSQYIDGHDYLAICVDTEKMKDIASQVSGTAQGLPYFRSVLIHDEELALRMREFFSLLMHEGSILQRESSFMSIISSLVMRHAESPPPVCRTASRSGSIERACDFIRAHFSESLSLEELSRVACLSPFHFQRLFLKSKGVSPHEYLVQTRISKARELLLEGHCLAGVAVDTGFVDQSHFTRSFKRIVGITPGRYLELKAK